MAYRPHTTFRPTRWLILLVLAAPLLAAGTVLKAVRVDKGPHFDGLLDDEVWKQAVPFTDFLQARPQPRSSASERTEARIVYDRENLYIAIYCYDSEPRKVSANTMAHDAEDMEESNDNVKILLDPFQDKRNAYIFFVNPRGARSEGLAFGEHSSLDWDGIWDAEARIRNDGWSAEIRIPFKTISFKPGLAAWGLNIERYIARKQETIRASGADLDSHFFNPNEAAALEGIENVKQGTGITIRPYGLGSATKNYELGTRNFSDPPSGFSLPHKNLMAARVSQNLWEESRVGLIYTDGNPGSSTPGDYNRLAGIDFHLATSRLHGDKNFSFDAWGVYNWWPDPEKKRHQGFGFRLDYPNDLWDMNSSYSYYGDGLNPGLGFISRPGVQTWSLMAAYMPRPEKSCWLGKYVRQFFFEPYAQFFWDVTGRLETRQLSFSPGIQLESGDRIEGDISSNYDVLPFDFEVADGVIIPMGPYQYTNFRAGFESASHRPYQFEFNQHFGQFYSGHLAETEISVSLKYKGYATLGVQTALIRGRLPQGNFNENIYELKADVFLSSNLGLMNYVQYDDVSKELGWQARFRWQISPGNEIFFVYNKNWERRWNPMSRFVPLGDHGVIKIQLTIRP